MARPKAEVDETLLESLAAIHCTVEEMASICGCSKDTLERRFAATIKRGKDTAKSSLRRHQWKAAEAGNTSMLIWLGKQLLDQKDISRVELSEIPDNVFAKEAQRRLGLVPGNT